MRGLGPWSVNYLMMRALGLADCVPIGDAALTRNLKRFYDLEKRPGAEDTRSLMEPFAPHRSLATFHFWALQGGVPMILYTHRISSPIGDLGLVVDESERVVRIVFETEKGEDLAVVLERLCDRGRHAGGGTRRAPHACKRSSKSTSAAIAESSISSWRRAAPNFKSRYGKTSSKYRRGETRTYSEIARRLGRPGAARAVGRANATNPIPIVVPCHRVIGADGTLTGYAGGLPIKQGLLAIEGDAMLPF